MPMKNLEECGLVKETGFVWMKQKEPYEHFFKGTETLVRYSREVTAYVEKNRMKKMTGVRSRQLLLWVPLSEMSIDDPEGLKITFNTPMGIGRSYPRSAFLEEEEEGGEPQKQ
ncbi:unnamed protein product [Spirodela intermedia]|nr:unnamed protein product [Spirodela intermedia]CAA6656361.1 unnamed protein product [Spirodela intermedia]